MPVQHKISVNYELAFCTTQTKDYLCIESDVHDPSQFIVINNG